MAPADRNLIRNFCIIAHIDHGKSTIADRILELTAAVTKLKMHPQYLDSMPLEQERGITIKLNAVRLNYHCRTDQQTYTFNLIDTPGHVDFSYEVSRSLAACEGALLVVDASQGVQAQTVATMYLALEHQLTIIPVINKIDLPHANVAKTTKQLVDMFGFKPEEIILVSAKTGKNIEQMCEAIVKRIPAPLNCDPQKPLQALVFDSYYDRYQGAIAFVKVVNGQIRPKQKIILSSTKDKFEVQTVGIKTPALAAVDQLDAGNVGFVAASIKTVHALHVGDTIIDADEPSTPPLPGYQAQKPMVFCGFYPVDNNDYLNLKTALEKLQLSDAALQFQPETSQALGHGFRCGFLGLLHLEIVQERLEREYDLNLIVTAPSTIYQVTLTNGTVEMIDNPSKLPNRVYVHTIAEPFVKAEIVAPATMIGPLMELCQEFRGQYQSLDYIDEQTITLTYKLPLSEIMFHFYNKLKSVTKGYASLDYSLIGYEVSDLVRLDILLNGQLIDALSTIVYRPNAYRAGRQWCEKLKTIIPRQNFEVPIQAAINQKIIARETIKAYRKDVIAKLYGGHVERKKKLLEKQKKGKKRMKQVGKVELPQAAFIAILETKS